MTGRDLRILITGGTIDKVHDPLAETIAFPSDGATQIPQILALGRCQVAQVQGVLQKDSLDFTDADRAAIAAAVAAAPERALVITHGTGTLGVTARFLQPHAGDRTIVLTGALRPHSLSASDASFNLGGAVIAAQILPPGVWGVMNGRAIPAAQLDKNLKTGRFDL